MFVKGVKIAKGSMFPIFRAEQRGSYLAIEVAGTGFFINSKGYFISVAHIFDGMEQDTKFLFFGRLPEQLQDPPLKIQEIGRNDQFDIFIGRIETPSPTYFYLSETIPEEGRSVCVSGYPLPEISRNSQGGPDLTGVRRYFQPSFVLDRARTSSDNGHGHIRTHEGFLIRDVGLFGMSGGPIFDKEGVVVGALGSVTPPRISQHETGRTISVENAIAIRSGLILDLLKTNRIRFNLFGRF
jgi:S1-C subfamily serine protease